MAEIKWIKITTTMFDDEKIKLIDAMPERDTIHYIWIRLLVQAGKTNANGYIFLNENVPYTEEMLSTIFNRPINSVRLALQTLSNFAMIEISDNNLIKISNWGKHQNIEGMDKVREQNRLRKQKQREREKILLEPVKSEVCGTENYGHMMSRDSHAIEEEREEEIERDIDKEEERENIYSRLSNKWTGSGFGTLNAGLIDKLLADVEMYSEQWVIEAIEQANVAGKRSYSYVKGILNNWNTEGRNKRKGAKQGGSSQECIKELEDGGLGFTV